MALVLFLAVSIFFHGALGELVCEELPAEMCSFSISSNGKRCLLETYASKIGITEFQCKTSEVVVNNMKEYIETDECMSACGLDRTSVGISSDTLLEPRFATKICSRKCSENCPNIVDLHTNLALAEVLLGSYTGVSLPYLCKVLSLSPRRTMFQLLSSGAAADSVSAAPTAAPGPIPGPN